MGLFLLVLGSCFSVNRLFIAGIYLLAILRVHLAEQDVVILPLYLMPLLVFVAVLIAIASVLCVTSCFLIFSFYIYFIRFVIDIVYVSYACQISYNYDLLCNHRGNVTSIFLCIPIFDVVVTMTSAWAEV